MAKLLDQFGRPISPATLKTEQAAPSMMGVRRPNTEHQASGLTPGKLARMLKSSINGDPEAYLALAEDMEERDLHYAGVLGARKLQVAGLDVTVEAASDSAEDVANADLVRAFVERDVFETEVFDILDAIGKGFSATEIIWEMSEKQWEPVALKWRDPRWFRFADDDGETPLLRDADGDQPLAPYKWVFHQAKVKSGLPIRGGIARAVCWTFLFKSFTGKDWAIFCEAYGQPLRLGKWGEGASEKDKETLLRAVANIGVDYSAIVPASMAVEFVKADVTGSHELYESRSDWLDRQVSKVVLGQTGTTDMTAGGYAQAKVHDGVKADIERSDAKQLAATLNRDLVRPYIDLNKGPQKAYPKIKIGRPEHVDLTGWIKNVATFVGMGGKVGMSTVRDKIGVPDPGKDEELLVPPGRRPSPADGSGDDGKPIVPGTPSAQRASNPAKPADAIDNAIADLLGDDGWAEMVEPVVIGLEEQIAGASTMEEVRSILADRYRTMDISAMTDMLARAAFSARLAGIAGDQLSDEA
jgi:phage gp29-like protein